MLLPPTPVVKKKPSPSMRKKRWVSIAIRDESYALLQQLAANQQRALGEVLKDLIETAYKGEQPIQPIQEKHDVQQHTVPNETRHRSRY